MKKRKAVRDFFFQTKYLFKIQTNVNSTRKLLNENEKREPAVSRKEK